MIHKLTIEQKLNPRDWFYIARCDACSWARSSYSFKHLERLCLEHGAVA
jgi:hypothetical protein